MLAILITSLIFMPLSLYIQLASGIASIPAVAIIMVILFTEIGRLLGSPFTKQEIFIIYEMSALAASATCYLAQVFKSYLMTSPLAWSFKVNGVPLPLAIPSWYAPPHDSIAYKLRTFFHRDWLIPLIVVNIQAGLFYYLVELSLTMLLAHLYIEVEPLPFPFASIDAAVITTLTERNAEDLRRFVMFLYPGMIWGAILYLIPVLTGITIVPLPWVDFTPLTAPYLPGAPLGLATDMVAYVGGFFIPLHIATTMLIGSVAVWVVGNYLTLTAFRSYFPEWVSEYYQGMNIMNIWQRASLRIWIVPQIACTLAVSIAALVFSARYVVRAFTSLLRVAEARSRTGYPSLWTLLAMYFAGSIGSVILFHVLVPDYPLWLAVTLSVGVSFLNALISTRSIGETGYVISIPYEWYATLYLIDYRKIDAWLISPVIGGMPSAEGGSPYWAFMVKVGYLTQTRPMDVIKALVYTIIIYNLMSFVWMEFFWRLAPIPSAAYPYALASWPVQLINQVVWITRQIRLSSQQFITPFIFMLVLSLAGRILVAKFRIPFSPVALVTGMNMIPPYVIPVFIGSLLGRFLFPRFFGKEEWERRRAIIAAGIASGEGIVAGIGIALLLLSKATWIKPW